MNHQKLNLMIPRIRWIWNTHFTFLNHCQFKQAHVNQKKPPHTISYSTNYYFVFSDILVPEVVNYGLADCIGNGFRVSWVPDVSQGEVSVVGTQGCILSPVTALMKTWGLDIFHFSLQIHCTFLPYCSLQGWPLWLHQQLPIPLASGLGLANGKLWWIFPFLIFHSGTCVLSLDRLLNVGCLTTLNAHFWGD